MCPSPGKIQVNKPASGARSTDNSTCLDNTSTPKNPIVNRGRRDHRIVRTDILFRKPFFRGQPLCLRGDLYLEGNRSVMLGGIHPVDPEGGVIERPSVFTRMEGEFSTAP